MRVLYRAKQFFRALNGRLDQEQLSEVEQVIGAQLFQLFLSMQPSEQLHSYNVYKSLEMKGHQNPDLFAAALLHDVGKSRYPLHLWERVWIVLGQKILPAQAKKWGNADPTGLKRAFVVARQHPSWGASMAAEAGASATTVDLIKRHQAKLEISSQQTISPEDMLLHQLQLLDEES